MDESKVIEYAKCVIAVSEGKTNMYDKDGIETANRIIGFLKTNNIQAASKKLSSSLTKAKVQHNEDDARKISKTIQQLMKL